MAIAQRSTFRAVRVLVTVGLAATHLGGCIIGERAPVRYPVDGEPMHIFADPIGFHYPDMVVHRSPFLAEPILREVRPSYPTYDPATGLPAPATTPTLPPAGRPNSRTPIKAPTTVPALPDPSKPFELPKPVDPAGRQRQ